MDKVMAVIAASWLLGGAVLLLRIGGRNHWSPAVVYGICWGAVLLLYAAVPIRYEPGLSFWTLLYILLAAAAFSLPQICYQLALRPKSTVARPSAADQVDMIDPGRLNRLLLACSLVGLVGSGIYTIEKLAFSGINYYELASAREQVLSSSRSSLETIGAILYPFGNVAFILAILYQEKTYTRSLLVSAVAGIAGTAWVSILNLGKSGIFVFVALTLSSLLLRKYWGLRLIYHRWLGKMVTVVTLILGTVGFLSFSWRGFFGSDTWLHYLSRFSGSVSPRLMVAYLSLGGIAQVLLANVLMLLLYITHSLNNLELFMLIRDTTVLEYGINQDRFVTPQLVHLLGMDNKSLNQTVLAPFVGMFNTWHYGTLLDFGYPGSLVFYFLVGLVGTVSFHITRDYTRMFFALLTVQLFTFGILSPLVVPLASSNSFQLLVIGSLVSVGGRRWVLRKST